MCFSAEASFVTAAVTGTIGLVSLTRAARPRDLPLAAMPIVFAVQQTVEGLLWLTLPLAPEGAIANGLTLLFLVLAEVFWPLYMPITVLLIEPNELRRRLMMVCLVMGAFVAAHLLWSILAQPHSAAIQGGHIVYVTEYRHSAPRLLAYLAATSLALMLSSRRTLLALGAIILAGSSVTYVFYWEAFVSIWCFFAAAASVVILCHFEWERRQRLHVADA